PEVGQYFRTSLGASGGIYNGLIMSLTFQANHGLINLLSLVDQSGNGNDGFNRSVSVVNLTNRPSVTIMPNESVEFYGNEDYLASADDAVISPTTAITLEAWIYPRNSNQSVFITKGPDYTLGYNGSAIIWGINNTFISTGVGLPINQWSHMALTYSASTNAYNFYLNGILRAQNNFNLGNVNNGTDSLYIGGAPGLPDLNGFLDEVRISNYAKSQQDINRYLYQSINLENEPNSFFANAVYNLDGLVTGSADGTPRLFFRNNARFSNPGAILNQPISPLDRNDPSNFSNGYYMTTSNKRIPESGTAGTTTDSTIVNLNATITDVNLYVALNHLNSFSLEIVLVGPNGDSVKVFDNKNTTSRDDNVITVFNDQADSSLINNRYATFSTVIKPENNMNSIFSGDNSQGRWKLIVRDEQANDIGFLYAWGIQINNISQRPKDLNLTSIIQGFYNPATDLMIPDTMRVYIHNQSSPFAIVDSSRTLLSSAGLGLFSFSSTNLNNNQSYYIQLKHRNSIETWSNPFNFVNDEALYLFINSANTAFGNNQIQVDNSPMRFAIYSGDVNQDGVIDLTDNQLIDNDANNFASGYVVTDINGDNVVDIADAAIADNNAFNFVGKIIP
ncbi:MAG: LamG-like jellyroll fold domain-containing protein, partial [bacterium]